VIFDDSDFGKDAEALRRDGKAVVGGTPIRTGWRTTATSARKSSRSAGLTVLPSWTFSGFEEAIQFVKAHPDRYVVKPSGSAQNEKVLSYVGQEEDGHDVTAILERYKRGWSKQIKQFQIQKFASGVEVAMGGFFNGKEFLLPVCVNFEHKKMFNGDIGPSTGEMGTSMFWVGDGPLYRETLAKMAARLAPVGLRGLFRHQLHRHAPGHLPLGMHAPVRLPDALHPNGRACCPSGGISSTPWPRGRRPPCARKRDFRWGW
jgi:phosphoribosylamine--glycine ligase